MWESGLSEKFGLYAVKNCTTGDTFDMTGKFRNILQSVWMGATVSGTVSGQQSGTVITVPAGLSGSGAYVLIQGVAF